MSPLPRLVRSCTHGCGSARWMLVSRQFSTFTIVALIGVAITSALSYGILSLLNASVGPVLRLGSFTVKSVFAAHFTAVGLTVLYSYPAHKCLSFNVGMRARLQNVYAQISERT